MSQSGHFNLVQNLINKLNAWMFVTITLVIVVLVLLYELNKALNDMPVRLVPYGLDSEVIVKGGAEGNDDYLARIATGDIKYLTDWNPGIIQQQINFLIGRLTPEAFIKHSQALKDSATGNLEKKRTQVFFPDKWAVSKGGVVAVQGNIRLWEGDVILENNLRKTFYITYEFDRGVPRIAGITEGE